MTIGQGPEARELLAQPLELTDSLTLRNRFVATAHGRGGSAVTDGLPTEDDTVYWERVSAGGAAMCIAGGTVIGLTSTYRRRELAEAWRGEIVEGMKRRAEAMRSGGSAACAQILHLGRETLGAETYFHPVAPSAVRSPREPNKPRALTDAELDEVIEGFCESAMHVVQAGFDVLELHAAHGYLLAQLVSPVANRRPGAETVEGRLEPIVRIARAVRSASSEIGLGIRFSVGDPDDAGLDIAGAAEMFSHLEAHFDYFNLTAGMRSDYVRDMGTTRPPLLDDVAELRSATSLPLLISHGFRDVDAMGEAVAAGADMVGMARALIADPDVPRKALDGEAARIRPCVACNEDCRSFFPSLLCTVNPDLAAAGDDVRRALPLLRGGGLKSGAKRVAVVGAGPGGLETAHALQGSEVEEIVLFDQAEEIGGAVALAGGAPNRSGWSELVRFYGRNLDSGKVQLRLGKEVGPADLADFDAIVVAIGAVEAVPQVGDGAISVSEAVAAGVDGMRGRQHLVVVDDGFSWWPHAMAVELGAQAGVEKITLVTPGVAFAMGIPAEGRVQMLKRLRGKLPLEILPLSSLASVDGDRVEIRSSTGGGAVLEADAVVVVGERSSRDWAGFEHGKGGPPVLVVGDAINPRRAAHAISEGRAAAEAISSASLRTLA